MLMSVDGKISTGDSDIMDVDKDYKNIPGLKEGLQQYYDLEQETDLFSLNTGRVFAKIGVNEKTDEPEKTPVSFIVVDNKPHLTREGIRYLAKKSQRLLVITTNKTHPAYAVQEIMPNVEVVFYAQRIDFADLMRKLYSKYKVDTLTVQSGGTLNTTLIRDGLIDRIMLVVAPALIGGRMTSTLLDGESLHITSDLTKVRVLELVRATPLRNSYLLLEYVVNYQYNES